MCFFFLFLVAFNNFFTSPVHSENARLTVVNDAVETLPLVTDKTIKDLLK